MELSKPRIQVIKKALLDHIETMQKFDCITDFEKDSIEKEIEFTRLIIKDLNYLETKFEDHVKPGENDL